MPSTSWVEFVQSITTWGVFQGAPRPGRFWVERRVGWGQEPGALNLFRWSEWGGTWIQAWWAGPDGHLVCLSEGANFSVQEVWDAAGAILFAASPVSVSDPQDNLLGAPLWVPEGVGHGA